MSKKASTQAPKNNSFPIVPIGDSDVDLMTILHLLKRSAGVDFTHHKMTTIKRRIVRRMLLFKIDSLKEYVLYLRQHTKEVTEFNTLSPPAEVPVTFMCLGSI